MESLKKNKTLVILFVISLIAFLGYEFKGMIISDTPTASVDTSITSEILSSLSEMQQAKIDSDLFTSTAWKNLVDYSIVLPSDTPGRPELFGSTFQSTGGGTTVLATTTTTKR